MLFYAFVSFVYKIPKKVCISNILDKDTCNTQTHHHAYAVEIGQKMTEETAITKTGTGSSRHLVPTISPHKTHGDVCSQRNHVTNTSRHLRATKTLE